MITAREVEKYRDSYDEGMNASQMFEFFRDCQKDGPDDEEFAAYTVEDLRELAEKVVIYMIHDKAHDIYIASDWCAMMDYLESEVKAGNISEDEAGFMASDIEEIASL